jgi:hypothetical protein
VRKWSFGLSRRCENGWKRRLRLIVDRLQIWCAVCWADWLNERAEARPAA